MKILHTADWHIGKLLYKQSLEEEFQKFSDWLIEFVTHEHIDVVLISGDIFDYANPSHADIQKYYKILNELYQKNVKVIATGGNHDSPGLLNGPKNLFQNMNVSVFGSLSEISEEHIVPLEKNGKTIAVVLAVPFLREKDLRKSRSLTDEQDADEQTNAVRNIYTHLSQTAIKKYGKIPLIAMGHLSLFGSLTSDSERDIHIGNIQGMPSSVFNENIGYVALGHIHKPQKINGFQPVYYSGSPVFLDFSEREYEKQIMMITVQDDDLLVKPIKLPVFRKMLKLAGNGNEIFDQLKQISSLSNDLPAFVELEWKVIDDLLEDKRLLQEILDVYEDHPALKILKSRFISSANLLSGLTVPEDLKTIEEMNPADVFRQLLEDRNIPEDKWLPLEKAHYELIESLVE